MRQPRGGGPHSTSRTWVGEACAHETSLAASSEGRRPVRCGEDYLLTKPLLDRIQELRKLVGVEYDEDSKTLEVQLPRPSCPRT